MFAQIGPPAPLTWPTVWLVILLVSLALTAYVLSRRYQSRKALMQRVTELEALRTAGRTIVESQHDVEALSELIANEAGLVIDNSTFQVGLFEGALYHILFWRVDGEKQEPTTFDLTENSGLVGWVRETKRPLLVRDFPLEVDSLPARPRYTSERPPRSALFLPLLSGEDSIGIIAAQHHLPNHFDEDDLKRLSIIANQAGSAFANARLFSQLQEQAWLTTAQLQIANTIGREQEMEPLVEATTRLTAMLVGTAFCGVLVWDYEFETYRWVNGYAQHHEIDEARMPVQIDVGDWSALDAVHVGRELLETDRIPHWLRPYLPPNTPLLLQPVIAPNNYLMGVLLIEQTESGETAVQQRRIELLTSIAQYLGQAIDNTNLRNAQQEEAWVNTALLQVAEAVNNHINLAEILDTIIRLVPMLVGVDKALILIRDEETELFGVGPTFGMDEMGIGMINTLSLSRPELNQLAVEETSSSQTVHYFRIKLEDWLQKSLDVPVALAFPLRARGQLVGILLIGTEEQLFSSRRLNILNGIAQQAATAVVNNQLYKAAAERTRLEQELDVAREIQASLIPLGNPDIQGCSVASYWEAARQVSGDFYDFIRLNNGRWGIVVADVADKGVPAALFMALSRTVLRAVAINRENPAETLMRVNQIIDQDAQTDLFITLFYTIWNCEKNQLTFSNAGHNPPILLRADGSYKLLNADGMALGVLPEVYIDQKTIDFHIGDVLVLYTDGVTEAMNSDYDEFDLPRLIHTASMMRHRSASEIIATIKAEINAHVGNTPQFDDITLMVIKREH